MLLSLKSRHGARGGGRREEGRGKKRREKGVAYGQRQAISVSRHRRHVTNPPLPPKPFSRLPTSYPIPLPLPELDLGTSLYDWSRTLMLCTWLETICCCIRNSNHSVTIDTKFTLEFVTNNCIDIWPYYC